MAWLLSEPTAKVSGTKFCDLIANYYDKSLLYVYGVLTFINVCVHICAFIKFKLSIGRSELIEI